MAGLSEYSKEVPPQSTLLWLAVQVAPSLSMVLPGSSHLPSACVHVSGWEYVHSSEGTHRDQEVSDPLKQELEEVVIYLVRVWDQTQL